MSRRSFLIGLGAASVAEAGGLFIAQRAGQASSGLLRLYGLPDLQGEGTFDACIVGSRPAGAVLGCDPAPLISALSQRLADHLAERMASHLQTGAAREAA